MHAACIHRNGALRSHNAAAILAAIATRSACWQLQSQPPLRWGKQRYASRPSHLVPLRCLDPRLATARAGASFLPLRTLSPPAAALW